MGIVACIRRCKHSNTWYRTIKEAEQVAPFFQSPPPLVLFVSIEKQEVFISLISVTISLHCNVDIVHSLPYIWVPAHTQKFGRQ